MRSLTKLIESEIDDFKILGVVDSVEQAVSWFKTFKHPDIVFLDIQLADGLSFEIFKQIEIESSVIFITAFDHYALRAFRVNGLDYLLKPIEKHEFRSALEKHERRSAPLNFDYSKIMETLSAQNKQFKERILVKLGDKYIHISMDDIAYIFAEDGVTFSVTTNGSRHLIDYTLEGLFNSLNPAHFFRINRKIIIHVQSLQRTHSYINGRLKLELEPAPSFDVIVSRDTASGFKEWLDR